MLRISPETCVAGAIGTAFFFKSNDTPYLITNWHNITGIHPENGKALHKLAMTPNKIRVFYKAWVNCEKKFLQNKTFDIALYNDDSPSWFEHSQRRAVDVIAIPFEEPSDWANLYINEVEQERKLEIAAGMDCFILGFPEGLSGAAFTPIWKRGSIAAEPYQDHPYYIDSATRRGMSGSPVIIKHSGIFGYDGRAMNGSEVIGTVERFVAIYSGRVGNDELGGQLGRAWQACVIDDILTRSTPGLYPHS